MAEAIGVASGLLTLVTFTLTSTKSLYQAVESFRCNDRVIRDLKNEVEALDNILKDLRDSVNNIDGSLEALRLPLQRCGHACNDFVAVIEKCSSHSSGSRTSFRDWAKLRYMGEDITGFRHTIAGYKATIMIALADANIRRIRVTESLLKEYKQLIDNTTIDLQQHLQDISGKLDVLSAQQSQASTEDQIERQRMQEESESTKQCLNICAQFSTSIEQTQRLYFADISTPFDVFQGPGTASGGMLSAQGLTNDALTDFQQRFSNTKARLETHLQSLAMRLVNATTRQPVESSQRAAEINTIREEIKAVQQSLAICAKASDQTTSDRVNVYEEIEVGEDGNQIIVSTIGALIAARKVTAGARSIQVLGQMNDQSLQHVSSRPRAGSPTDKDLEEDKDPKEEKDPKEDSVAGSQFKGRYGSGRRLR